MTERGISIEAVENTLRLQPFEYFHAGATKTGFYDATNNLFVGTVDDTITTVIRPSGGQAYVDRLLGGLP